MEENKKPVENVLEGTLKNLKSLIDVDCIVGNPISSDDTTVIPISKVTLGFVTGGGEYESDKKKKKIFTYPFAGGSGGGCNLTPIGFLVIGKEGQVNFIKINSESNLEKIIEIANNMIEIIKK